jgi:hypothetical protein
MRCAHAAEVHPRRSATIIVFGGFSRNTDPDVKDDNNMTDELLLLHTDRWAHLLPQLQLRQHHIIWLAKCNLGTCLSGGSSSTVTQRGGGQGQQLTAYLTLAVSTSKAGSKQHRQFILFYKYMLLLLLLQGPGGACADLQGPGALTAWLPQHECGEQQAAARLQILHCRASTATHALVH